MRHKNVKGCGGEARSECDREGGDDDRVGLDPRDQCKLPVL